jgi:Arm DNA-binding domain
MFTDKAIKGLKPKLSAYRLYEKAADKGFGVKVTPAGSKSFLVQYSVSDGHQKFFNLGRILLFHCRMPVTNVAKSGAP